MQPQPNTTTPDAMSPALQTTPATSERIAQRYRIGHSLQSPWIVDLCINHAETMTAEELAADMPRIHAALLRNLESVRREKALELAAGGVA